MKRLPNDIGGSPADRIERVDHELEPWEKRCHALADVLDFHKIINTEEKRRGVEALGAEMVGKLTYYERWIAAFANILFQKQILDSRGAGPEDGRSGATASRALRPNRATPRRAGADRVRNLGLRMALEWAWTEDAMSSTRNQKMSRRGFCLCCVGGAAFTAYGPGANASNTLPGWPP